jgi:hypothetical protein
MFTTGKTVTTGTGVAVEITFIVSTNLLNNFLLQPVKASGRF